MIGRQVCLTFSPRDQSTMIGFKVLVHTGGCYHITHILGLESLQHHAILLLTHTTIAIVNVSRLQAVDIGPLSISRGGGRACAEGLLS